MSFDPRAAWEAIAGSPMFGLALTLLVYQGAVWLFDRCGRRPAINPVLVTMLAIIGILSVSGIAYQTYFDSAKMVHLLLGPATVALAVPLYRQVPSLIRSWPAVLTAAVTGSAVALISVVIPARLLGAPSSIQLSLAPKSVTTPIAMGVSERIGGIPSLTAVLVVLTGVIGAVFGSWILNLVRVRSPAARGLAFGISAHAIGTTRAFQEGETQGAYAGLAIGLAGIVTAILTPLLIVWLTKS